MKYSARILEEKTVIAEQELAYVLPVSLVFHTIGTFLDNKRRHQFY